MTACSRRQLFVFGGLLVTYALLVFVAYAFFPPDHLFLPSQVAPSRSGADPPWLLGLASSGMVFVMYGPLGLLGYWLARNLELPGMFREGATWDEWFLWPAILGLALGSTLVAIDQVFVASGSPFRIPHPRFPFSIVASACAALGEEMIFRLFAMAVTAFLLSRVLSRRISSRSVLWGANGVAALLFGAGHLPSVMVFLGVTSPAAIPPVAWAEILLLCTIVGLAAGESFVRDGLVAAVGVHFWTDVVWHVLWPFSELAG